MCVKAANTSWQRQLQQRLQYQQLQRGNNDCNINNNSDRNSNNNSEIK